MSWSVDQARRAALGRLLHPHTLEEFGALYYERRPLFVERDDPSYYGAILKLSDVEEILYERQIPFEDCDVMRGGVLVPRGEYVNEGFVDADRLSRLMARGASVALSRADVYSGKVHRLCNDLEAALGHGVSAQLHVLQGVHQGFDVSYDTHDTLALQLEGICRWRVYNAPYPLPVDDYPEQHFHHTMPVGEASSDIGMDAGDMLYLPRGFLREGWSEGGLAIHLTIGLHSVKWVEVAIEAVKGACNNDVVLRRTVEGAAHADFDDAEVRASLSGAFSAQALQSAKERLDAAFLSQTSNLLTGQLAQIRGLSQLDENSFVSIREPMFYHAEEWDEGLMLQFSGKRVSLPKSAAGLIAELASVRVTRAGDLLKYGDDALDIIRELINEGFVVQAARATRRGPVLREIVSVRSLARRRGGEGFISR